MHRFKMPRDRAYNDDVEEKKLVECITAKKKVIGSRLNSIL